MALEIRPITDNEVPRFREAVMMTFGADASEDDKDGDARQRALLELAQTWAAFDGSMIVGTAATFNLAIGVPGGGTLPVAGLTMVSVRPSHRRRGIMRELIRLHLDDARTRGYSASALWASDASIYGRFGYGLAAFCEAYDISNAHQLAVAGDAFDELEPIDETRARESLPAIYARATADRPGALRRSDVWWRERRFLEVGRSRAGASLRRHVVAKRGDELVGYMAFRQRAKFTDGMPDGRIEIIELLAVDPQAEATLWQFAMSMDLFPHVNWWNAPADDALPWLVDDMRRIKRRRSDGIYLRIEDVPAALGARGYDSDGALRFAIGGTTYELVASNGRGECTVTTKPAELTLSQQTLGTLYLGCTSATQLARAQLVRGERAAIALADRLFASTVAPWCPESF